MPEALRRAKQTPPVHDDVWSGDRHPLIGHEGQAADAVAACLDSDNDATRLKAAQWVLERGLQVSGGRNRATDTTPLGEVEVFLQLVAIGVDK